MKKNLISATRMHDVKYLHLLAFNLYVYKKKYMHIRTYNYALHIKILDYTDERIRKIQKTHK